MAQQRPAWRMTGAMLPPPAAARRVRANGGADELPRTRHRWGTGAARGRRSNSHAIPLCYALCPMAERPAIGIDFGGTHLRAGLVDPDGRVTHFSKRASRAGESAEAPLEAIVR